MNLLEQAAAWLRGALAEQSWLGSWQATIAATPDWALLAAGPTAAALLALMLRASWPTRRTADAAASMKSRRSTEPPGQAQPAASAPAPKAPPKIQAASAADADDNRSVRVFVSSTFLDMQAERRELVTKVFPALRAKYRARGVEVFEVDLRWGIMREQQERGETLSTLLAEIDRCRPYFIGLLGDRFGWVPPPEARSTKLKADFPAIADAEGMSVTAMEIMHGVMANPDIAVHAIFFERDPNWDWISTLDEADRPAAAMESDDARAKLTELKAQVQRRARVELYAKPEDIRQKVFDALDRLLEARFPEQGAPDAFEQATSLHRAYARERRVLHVGAERYIATLNAWAGDDGAPPMLITGKSGGGKSTLIANWLHARRAVHQGDIVFEHYLGASPDSADPMLLMRRLWEQLNRATGEVVELPPGNADLMDVSAGLAQRLAQARVRTERGGSTLLIVLDGLDKLTSEQNLRWLPLVPGVRLLASAFDGDSKDAALARDFQSLEVEPLTEAQRREFIRATLTRWGRNLEPEHIERLLRPASEELAGSPLYLKTVLDELRVSADHARLDARLDVYCTAAHMPDLFDRVLTRLEQDCEPGLVGKALPLIWASRAGLEETEIIAIIGTSPLAWATLRNGLGDGLRDQSGRIAFAHDYLNKAVRARYVQTVEARRAAHVAIADRFESRDADQRQAEELPFQLHAAQDWHRLESLLNDLKRFTLLRSRGDAELLAYWQSLGAGGRELEQRLSDRLDETVGELAAEHADALRNDIYLFLRYAGGRGSRMVELARGRVRAAEGTLGPTHEDTLVVLTDLAVTLRQNGDLVAAQEIQERVLDVHIRHHGEKDLMTIALMNNLANTLSQRGDFAGARALQERAFATSSALEGPEHEVSFALASNLAMTLSALGEHASAQALQEQVVSILARRYGFANRGTLTAVNNLAHTLMSRGDLAGALTLVEPILALMFRLGPKHPDAQTLAYNVAKILGTAAATFQDHGDLALAEQLFDKQFQLCEEFLGPEDPLTLTSLSDLANALTAHDAEEKARDIHERVLAVRARLLGPEHADTLASMHNLAAVLFSCGKLDAALEVQERVTEDRARVLGADHIDSLRSANNLAVFLAARGDFARAIELARNTLDARLRLLGADHPDTDESTRNVSLIEKRMHAGS